MKIKTKLKCYDNLNFKVNLSQTNKMRDQLAACVFGIFFYLFTCGVWCVSQPRRRRRRPRERRGKLQVGISIVEW